MCEFMIFKSDTNTPQDEIHYEKKIDFFSKKICGDYLKRKKVLIITGSGISSTVPDMKEIMDKIEQLIDCYDDSWEKSDVFNGIYEDYRRPTELEKHQTQSRLLTYIQNAYMGKFQYVQDSDIVPLANVWRKLVVWLLEGDKGLLSAEPTECHRVIRDMYNEMNVISLTTNFDNLLKKAFDKSKSTGTERRDDLKSESEDAGTLHPILSKEEFDLYYTSEENDKSVIEIQSRGDVFWLECTGEKNKICPNKNKQCFIPGESIEIRDDRVQCNLCKSEAKVYFAFPGTKEKDSEMSIVINGIWKYFANAISCVIIIGNSMNYDPVIVDFLRELLQKRQLPVMYISRYDRKRGREQRNYESVYGKRATSFLFSNRTDSKGIWARCENTEMILEDILQNFKKYQKEDKVAEYNKKEYEEKASYFWRRIDEVFSADLNFDDFLIDLKENRDIEKAIFDIDKVNQMRHFSQLGLKTYWLRGKTNIYQKHNRLKHSVGVMLISSYLYLKICPKPNSNELTFIQLAALFHDLGHLPFSHLLEDVFNDFGWISVGESTTFNHEQHTRRIIEEILENNEELKKLMNKINYSTSELQQLINGEYGIGFIDALINSPLDCDKIEYLFSDAIFMNRGTKEDFIIFMKDYVENLSVNENNFLTLKRSSTKAFLKLISMRGEMYDQVYLRSGLRYLEACCKLIIRTFISYVCTEQEVFLLAEDEVRFPSYYNLSDCKINRVVSFMEKCTEGMPDDEVCELYVLKEMVKSIESNMAISESIKNTIKSCMDIIEKTKGNDAVNKIEEEKVLTFEVSHNGFSQSTLKQIIKNVYLRFPGIILVDYVESKSSFSFGNREMRKRRSDGTKSATENILIKDIKQIKGHLDPEFKCLGDVTAEVNKELNYSNHNYINIYRISDNSFSYMQAEDYTIHELRKEGIIDEG